MIYLQILGFVLMIAGLAVVWASAFFVKKFKMIDKVTSVPDYLLEDEEAKAKYKLDTATLRVKMIGAGICLPGAVLIFILFSR